MSQSLVTSTTGTQNVSASLKKAIEAELEKEQATAGGASAAGISIHGTWARPVSTTTK